MSQSPLPVLRNPSAPLSSLRINCIPSPRSQRPCRVGLVTLAKAVTNFGWKVLMSELAPQDKLGNYLRPSPAFVGEIEPAASSPLSSYALYLGNACPWCHRVAVAIVLLGLSSEDGFGSQGTHLLRVVRLASDPEKASRGGWILEGPDPLVPGAKDLREVYDDLAAGVPGSESAAGGGGGYRGRVTAPLLVDASARRIVANDSRVILRSLATLAAPLSRSLRPAGVDAAALDAACAWGQQLSEGVYRAGFATSQAGYDSASADCFAALDAMEAALSTDGGFLVGPSPTEADVLAYPAVARWDAIYAPLFRLHARGRLAHDCPGVEAWRSRMEALPGVAATLNLAEAKRSYWSNLFPLNPSGIVPR